MKKRIFSLLMAVCMAVSLLPIPAHAETVYYCGLEEHAHGDSCKQPVKLCQEPDHRHDETCPSHPEQVLICTLPKPHAHEEGTCELGEDGICKLDRAHVHTGECTEQEDGTWSCGCVTACAHADADTCYKTETVSDCTIHVHASACYSETETELTCGFDYEHTHTGECGIPKCNCETLCAAEAMASDCPICSADGAMITNCKKYVAPDTCTCGAEADENGVTDHIYPCPLFTCGCTAGEDGTVTHAYPCPAFTCDCDTDEDGEKVHAYTCPAFTCGCPDEDGDGGQEHVSACPQYDCGCPVADNQKDHAEDCPGCEGPLAQALSPEAEARMWAGLQNAPALLTLEDVQAAAPGVVAQSGASAKMRGRATAAPNPGSYLTTADNENNSGTGTADGDMDKYVFKTASDPIEANVVIPTGKLPTQSCFIAVRTYDVNWQGLGGDNAEYDRLYVNGHFVGVLTGLDYDWNTSYYNIPVQFLKEGSNLIQVRMYNLKPKSNFTSCVNQDMARVGENIQDTYGGILDPMNKSWAVNIDWMQLVCDGGAKDEITTYKLKLKDAYASDGKAYVQVSTEIVTTKTGLYTEYSITDSNGVIVGSYQGSGISGDESFAVSMPQDSASGIYTVQGLLKDADGLILATDQMQFKFEQGVGAAVGPKLSHSLSPMALTNGNVTATVKIEDDSDCTNIRLNGSTISGSGLNLTIGENGTHEYALTFTDAEGESKTLSYSVTVNNIDKEPPVITAAETTLTVMEDTAAEDVEKALKNLLTLSDNRTSVEKIQLTFDADALKAAAKTGGPVTFTAKDEAANTTTTTIAVAINWIPAQLTMKPAKAQSDKTKFDLTAMLDHTGGHTITETGFVWGSMQNPTLELNNGTAETADAVTAKGGELKVTATDIVAGIAYYARAYAKYTDGSTTGTFYSEQVNFGEGVPQFGVFSVQNNGDNSFTISRTGGSAGEQTVHYRTVNGSAIGGTPGTHFNHAVGTLTFNEGVTSQTVTVTEHNVNTPYSNSNPATAYANADRVYFMEIYRVEGGATIDTDKDKAKAMRTMTGVNKITKADYTALFTSEKSKGVSGGLVSDQDKNYAANYNVNFHNGRNDTVNKTDFPAKNFNVVTDFSDMYQDVSYWNYLEDTISCWYYRYELNATEIEQCYLHFWLGSAAPPERYIDCGKDNAAPSTGLTGHFWTAVHEIDGSSGGTAKISAPQQKNGFKKETNEVVSSDSVFTVTHGAVTDRYVKLALSQSAHCYFGANGQDADGWRVKDLTSYAILEDKQEPQLLDVAPMAEGTTYLPGQEITVALIFDEIVDEENSTLSGTTITTANGYTLPYAGGANTNVLYFTGEVPENASSDIGAITIHSKVMDMCDSEAKPVSVAPSGGSITVQNDKPTVSITKATTGSLPKHSGTVSASNCKTVQYAWTNTAAVPVVWEGTAESGDVLESRRENGTWYLHLLATHSNGRTVHTSQAFTFRNPTLTASVSYPNDWKPSKTITVTPANTAGTISIKMTGPMNQTYTSSITIPNVTQNGTYSFTLTDGYGTVITDTLNVQKIDPTAPTVSIKENGDTESIHNALDFVLDPADEGGSGVAKVEYILSSSEPAATSGWALASEDGNGRYTVSHTETSDAVTAKSLYVRVTDGAGNVTTAKSEVYQLVKAPEKKEEPTITLDHAPADWTKNSLTLNWSADVKTATWSILDGFGSEITDSKEGSITVTKNGVYYVSVTDANGYQAQAKAVVNCIDKEAPTVASHSVTGGWQQKKTVTLSGISDDNSPIFMSDGIRTGYNGSGVKTIAWQKSGGSTWTSLTASSSASFPVTENGNYTVRITDGVGNVTDYPVTVSGIDTGKPTANLNVPEPNANGWYRSNPTVSLTYYDEDGGSGIQSVQYKLVTSTGTKPTTGLADFPGAGVSVGNGQYLYYKVTDNAGNVTEGFSQLIQVDGIAPTLSVTGGDTGAESLNLSVTATFGGSGGTVTVSKDGGTAATVSGNTHPVNAAGTYTFTATSKSGLSTNVRKTVCSVSFDTNKAESAAIPTLLVVSGGTVSAPTAPTRTGYSFLNWKTDNSEYTFGSAVTSNLQLKAVWKLNGLSVTVSTAYGSQAGPQNYVYDGSDLVLTAEPVHAAPKLNYSYQWSLDGEELPGKTGESCTLQSPGAGEHLYTCSVTVTDSDGLESRSEASNQITIAKAPVSFTVSGNVHNYDTLSHTATISHDTALAEGGYSVSYVQNGTAVTNPTNVGEYDVVVTLNNHNLCFAGEEVNLWIKTVGKLTIKQVDYPAKENLELTTAANLVYGQELHESALTGGDGGGVFTWKDGSIIPTVANNGYTVIFTPKDTNYAPFEKTVPITVSKKQLSPAIALTSSSKVYDGTTDVSGAGIVLTGEVNNEKPSATAAYAYNSPNVNDANTITATGITLTDDWGANYELSQDTATIGAAITRATLTPSISLPANPKVYDGTVDVPGAGIVLTGAVISENPTATAAFAYDSPNVQYASTVTATDIALTNGWGANYVLSQDTATIGATIAKAPQDKPEVSSCYATSYTVTLTVPGSHGKTQFVCSREAALPVSPAWQESPAFTALDAAADYYFFVRYEGTDNYEPSEAVSVRITTSAAEVTWVDADGTHTGTLAQALEKNPESITVIADAQLPAGQNIPAGVAVTVNEDVTLDLSGGEIAGTVTNDGTITGGVLSGSVTNSGAISGSTVSGDATNSGTISGSTVSGDVTNTGTITGGTVTGTVTGGHIAGTVDNDGTLKNTTIDAGAVVDNTHGTIDGGINNGTVTGGSVSGSVDNNGMLTNTTIAQGAQVDNTTGDGIVNGGTIQAGATVTGGTIQGEVTNYGTIDNAIISGNVENYGTMSTFTVSFDLQGGTGSVDEITGIVYKTAIKAPADPTKPGYAFGGWYKEQESTAYDFSKPVTAHFTLCAKWERLDYTITYELDGGENPTGTASTYTVESQKIVLPEPTRDYHIFEGWYEESTFQTKVTEIPTGSTGNKVFYARWSYVAYEIIQGAGQTVTQGDAAAFTSDAPFDKFAKVQVDGEDLDPENYTAESGSTVVTLESDYTEKLSVGGHTLRIVSDDGWADTTFTVKARPADADSPRTGDTTHSGLWLTVAGIGLAGFLSALIGRKKYRKRK